jgi:hypothetical protein
MGAISALEYREKRYVGALLRSFGVHPAVIVLRHWMEAAALGNACLLASGSFTLCLAPIILGCRRRRPLSSISPGSWRPMAPRSSVL